MRAGEMLGMSASSIMLLKKYSSVLKLDSNTPIYISNNQCKCRLLPLHTLFSLSPSITILP
ncbi:unnamed protein product [Arctogadus glacialis]